MAIIDKHVQEDSTLTSTKRNRARFSRQACRTTPHHAGGSFCRNGFTIFFQRITRRFQEFPPSSRVESLFILSADAPCLEQWNGKIGTPCVIFVVIKILRRLEYLFNKGKLALRQKISGRLTTFLASRRRIERQGKIPRSLFHGEGFGKCTIRSSCIELSALDSTRFSRHRRLIRIMHTPLVIDPAVGRLGLGGQRQKHDIRQQRGNGKTQKHGSALLTVHRLIIP